MYSRKDLIYLLSSLALAAMLTGCYTQLAPRVTEEARPEYSEALPDSNEEYGEYAAEEAQPYESYDRDVDVYIYGGYPVYHYYAYDPYWDPFYYDPFWSPYRPGWSFRVSFGSGFYWSPYDRWYWHRSYYDPYYYGYSYWGYPAYWHRPYYPYYPGYYSGRAGRTYNTEYKPRDFDRRARGGRDFVDGPATTVTRADGSTYTPRVVTRKTADPDNTGVERSARRVRKDGSSSGISRSNAGTSSERVTRRTRRDPRASSAQQPAARRPSAPAVKRENNSPPPSSGSSSNARRTRDSGDSPSVKRSDSGSSSQGGNKSSGGSSTRRKKD